MFYLYKIENKINGKFYIGKTNNTSKRWKQHCYYSKNKSNLLIHKAIRKYGLENFDFIIINKYDTEKEVCEAEINEIKISDKNKIYNIALGGNGGLTMDIDRINSQYSIGKDRYDEFIALFNDNKTQIEISIIMNVGKNSVVGCAKRLGLSFTERRKKINKNKKSKIKLDKRKYSDEERKNIWSKNISSINKKRGISDDLKKEVITRYFSNNETCKYISDVLKINTSTIRGVVNREYNLMDDKLRNDIKKIRASIVRTGSRNSNYKKHKIINSNL